MDFPPKIVASVTSKDEAGRALAMGADIVELRVDLATGDPQQLVEGIYYEYDCPIIVTIRPEFEGGKYKGTDQERVALFKKLAPCAAYLDVELRAPNAYDLIGAAQGEEAMVIVSYHDFNGTPSTEEMQNILDESLAKGSIAKLAVTPKDLTDVLRLLDVTLKAQRPVCTIAMGEYGRHTRLIAPVYGSWLTYGYVTQPVAPGQLRVDEILAGLKILGLRQ